MKTPRRWCDIARETHIIDHSLQARHTLSPILIDNSSMCEYFLYWYIMYNNR